MKFAPHQWVGLGAVIVFGGYLVFQLTKPPRDPMILPSGVDLRTLPSPSSALDPPAFSVPDIGPVPSLPPPSPPAPPPAPPQPPADPLAIGTAQAKDDLYCAGVMTELGKVKANKIDPGDAIELDLAGKLSLISDSNAGDFSDMIAKAHEDKAATETAAGKARLTKETCHARVETLRRTPVH
jgi:hypothetical protein